MPIIDNPETVKKQTPNLLTWLMPKLRVWKEYRDNNYKTKWDEYYRLWRGIWNQEDKTRQSERSHLVSPALQQAIEASVAEIEEATFGRGYYFDIRDDVADPTRAVERLLPLFREDLDKAGLPDSLSESVLIGALYGTGIGEIMIDEYEEKHMIEIPVPDTNTTARTTNSKKRIRVWLNPIMPGQFLIDPSSKDLDDGLGWAIEDIVPKHQIVEGIRNGVYNAVAIGSFTDTEDLYSIGETTDNDNEDKVKIIRYYGKVPKIFLEQARNEKKVSIPLVEREEEYKDDKWDLVEAIVVIANDRMVLKATKNPYLMQDRPGVFFQWDRVPRKFYGRGVAEKGYNPQKALDAELRARIDAMALATHPMMGVDATRLPRGMKFEVSPGKTILTNGPPNEILFPVKFGDISPNSFAQSGDLERQIQMGTGAMDSQTGKGQSQRNSTAGGMSMMLSASIKRQKRNLQNFQRNFLEKFLEKALWRFIQFDPKHYPVADTKFKALGTLGIMAREYEQQQFIQLLSVTPPDSPLFPVIVKGIIDNSSVQNRADMVSQLEEAMAPNPQKEQMEMALQQAQIDQINADIEYKRGQLEGIKIKAQLDMAKLQVQKEELLQLKPETALEAKRLELDSQFKQAELQLKEREQNLKDDIERLKLSLEAEKLKITANDTKETGISDAKIAKLENELNRLQLKAFVAEKGKITVDRNEVGEMIGLRIGE